MMTECPSNAPRRPALPETPKPTLVNSLAAYLMPGPPGNPGADPDRPRPHSPGDPLARQPPDLLMGH